MIPNDEQLEEFRKIYLEVYGEEITREKALEEAIKLIQLMKIVYKPMTEEAYVAILNHRIDTYPLALESMREQLKESGIDY